ncbi:MAG: hypothetical protein JSR96_00785 [Proteobacteria bacterium]|nr:hypothetical protein [Pseudomonadota bacterium]
MRRLRALIALLVFLLAAHPAAAANCNVATGQGTAGPSDWQSYCWLDLSGYNDTTARSAGGQTFSYTLPDGTTMSFVLKVSGNSLAAVASPSYGGASFGTTAFTGVAGSPILYQTSPFGTSTVTFSNITLTPPASGTISQYMFVAADGEATAASEALAFTTNGGGWQLLEMLAPTSGSSYPVVTGLGTSNVNEVGSSNSSTGAAVVGSTNPTTVTANINVSTGGYQGALFAVRFASIVLNTQISGARVAPTDQFGFSINSTSGGTTFASGTSTGTGLGPFQAAVLNSTAAIPLTLKQTMASGSTNAISHYLSSLSCTNLASGSTTVMPSNVKTTSYNLGALKYGDVVKCTYTETPYPHLTLIKALGSGGRVNATTDQFTLKIDQGATNVVTTTTTGSNSTITNGSTPQTQVTAGTTYTLSEAASGGTNLTQYVAAMNCTNASSSSSTTLPTSSGGTITPAMGDVVSCTITNTKKSGNAILLLSKTSTSISDPVDGTINPKLIPGAVVEYSIALSNAGSTAADANSVVIADILPSQLQMNVGAVYGSSPVSFTDGSPSCGVTATPGAASSLTDSLDFSTDGGVTWTYSPAGSGYDAAVNAIRVRFSNALTAGGGGTTTCKLKLQAQIR